MTTSDPRDAFNTDLPLPEPDQPIPQPGDTAGSTAPASASGPASDPRHIALGLTMRTLGEIGVWIMVAAMLWVHGALSTNYATWIVLISGAIRGLAHAEAGRRLLRDGARGLRWQWLYRAVAVVQAAVVLPAMYFGQASTVGDLILLGALLLAWPVASVLALRRRPRRRSSAVGRTERGLGAVGAMMWIPAVAGIVVGVGIVIASALLASVAGPLAALIAGLFGATIAIRAQTGLSAARQADAGGFAGTFVTRMRRYLIASAVSVVAIAVLGGIAANAYAQVLPRAGIELWGLLVVALALVSVWPRVLFGYTRRHLLSTEGVALPNRDPVGVGAALMALGLPLLVMATGAIVDAVSASAVDFSTLETGVIALLSAVAGVCLWLRTGRLLVLACAVIVGGLCLIDGFQDARELLPLIGEGLPAGLIAVPLLMLAVQLGVAITVPLGVLRLGLQRS